MGGRRGQSDVRVPGEDSLSRGDSGPSDEALELRAVHHSGAGERQVFFPAQQWTAKSERAASGGGAECRAAGAAGSEHGFVRWGCGGGGGNRLGWRGVSPGWRRARRGGVGKRGRGGG